MNAVTVGFQGKEYSMWLAFLWHWSLPAGSFLVQAGLCFHGHFSPKNSYETCSENKEGNHSHKTLLGVENGSQNPTYLCISQTLSPLLIPPPIVPPLLPTSSPLRGRCPLSQVSPHLSASSFYRVRSILSHYQYKAALCGGEVLSPAIWFVTQSPNVAKGPGQLMVLIFLWSSYPPYGPLFFQLFHEFLTFV